MVVAQYHGWFILHRHLLDTQWGATVLGNDLEEDLEDNGVNVPTIESAAQNHLRWNGKILLMKLLDVGVELSFLLSSLQNVDDHVCTCEAASTIFHLVLELLRV